MIVCSDYAIEKGEQLLNMYGRKHNKNLLLYYGFCLRRNEYDRFMFRIAMIADSYEDFKKNIESLVVDNYIKNID